MNKRILAIFGSGGQGKEVRELADLDNKVTNKWDEIIFVDDVQPEGRLWIRLECIWNMRLANIRMII